MLGLQTHSSVPVFTCLDYGNLEADLHAFAAILTEPSPKPLLLLWSKCSPSRNQKFMLDFLSRPLQQDLELQWLIFKGLSHPCVLEINFLWLWSIIFFDTLLELILRIFHNLYSWRKPALYFLSLWCLFEYQNLVYISGSSRVSSSFFFFSGEFLWNGSLPFLNILWNILMNLNNCDVSFVRKSFSHRLDLFNTLPSSMFALEWALAVYF